VLPGEPVVRVRGMSVGRFRVRHLARSRPVVLEGAAADWPAMKRWSSPELRARCGGALVTAYAVRDGHAVFDGRTGLVVRRLPLAAFLDELEGVAAARHRVRARLARELPTLEADVDPRFARHGPPVELSLWMSAACTWTRLHFDVPHNVLAQVRGEKRVLLVAPSQRRAVYPRPPWAADAQFSRVDLRAPDYARFPRLRRLRPLVTTLRPGDALFIPSGWWHYVEADEPTLSVGAFWAPWTRWPLAAAVAAYKRVRGIEH
jgi:hypothetical protein